MTFKELCEKGLSDGMAAIDAMSLDEMDRLLKEALPLRKRLHERMMQEGLLDEELVKLLNEDTLFQQLRIARIQLGGFGFDEE